MGLFAFAGVGAIEAPEAPVPAVITPVPASIELSSVRLTAYNAVPEQTDSTPDITASGAKSNPQVVAARSRDFADEMPFGTIIELTSPTTLRSCGFEQVEEFIGYRVIADVLHARKTEQVDIMFDIDDSIQLGEREVNPAIAMGICNVTVRVVGYVDINNIPSTQEELAMIVNNKLALK